MRPMLFAFYVLCAISLTACKPRANVLAEGMVECRIQFDSAYSTLVSAGSSLNAQQKLDVLVDVIEKRNNCERRIGK